MRCWKTLPLSRYEAFKHYHNKNRKDEWEYQDTCHFGFFVYLEQNIEITYWWYTSNRGGNRDSLSLSSILCAKREGSPVEENGMQLKDICLIHLLNRNIQGKRKPSLYCLLTFACLSLHSHCLALVFRYRVIQVMSLKLYIMFIKVKALSFLVLLLLLLPSILKHRQTINLVALAVLCLYGP